MLMKKSCDVPYIGQMPKWPTGCESVSAVMLLRHLGIDITVDEFIAYLPKAVIKDINGRAYSESPNKFFIGSPYDDHSFGCYAQVIVETINNIFLNYSINLLAKDISVIPTEDIVKYYIDRGMPVLYWATIDLMPSFPGATWNLVGCDNASFTWRSNEHCMLLVGYDDVNYYFNDPWNNNGLVKYPKELTITRHKEMYSMAVAIDVI